MRLKRILPNFRRLFGRKPPQAGSLKKGVETFTNTTLNDLSDTIGLRGHQVSFQVKGPATRIMRQAYAKLVVSKEAPPAGSSVVCKMDIDGQPFFVYKPF